MPLDGLPDGWTVWSEEATKVVLAYRPDVFDTATFPAPCLPTIYLTKGRRGRRPGRDRPGPEDPWFVTLFLEPDVKREKDSYDSREEATTGAVELATAFDAGEIDYRGLYQVPRPDYFEKLDDLTDRDPDADGGRRR